MKIYENVVIGNFLYGLGFAVRASMNKDAPLPCVVNLLQQTPADRELGDVLLTFPGLVRLIEFKMKGARIEKEKRRHTALTIALSGENKLLVDTSKCVHWYVEMSARSDQAPLISRVVPYLDAFTDLDELSPGSLEQLVQKTAREAVLDEDPQSRERARAYLDLVRLTLGKEDPVGAGGLLLVMDADGGMYFAQLQDIVDLNLPDRQWLEMALRGPKLDSPSRTKELQQELDEPLHEITHGMGY